MCVESKEERAVKLSGFALEDHHELEVTSKQKAISKSLNVNSKFVVSPSSVGLTKQDNGNSSKPSTSPSAPMMVENLDNGFGTGSNL